MTKSPFEKTPTTPTDTLLVSDQRVMDQFTRTLAEALESAESAVTFAGALSDRDLSLALAQLDLLQATAKRGHNAIIARMREKPAPAAGENFVDEFSIMEDASEFAEDEEDLWEDIEGHREEVAPGLITVATAAQILGLPGEEVILLMNTGSLKTVASGGLIMLHEDDVRGLKDRAPVRPNTPPAAKPVASPTANPDEQDFDTILARLFEAPELQE